MMKQQKVYLLAAVLLATLLVCCIVPSSSLAVGGESNDNHTDTADYCLRAHDVTVGLSEFSTKTRAELESDIITASAFVFLIRDSANPTGLFVPITTGYSVDFSNLTEAASSSGYVITVTLPAITLPQDSHIIFRVFVEDDLPHPRTVHYEFVSTTAGHTLPAGVTGQLPAEETILSGNTVTPSAALTPVRDGAGVWTFSGWTPESVVLADSDVSFTGTWVWTALPVYTVSYVFVCGTDGRTLPDGVLAKLPMDTTGVDGDLFTPSATFRAFHMIEGVWRFYGWNAASQTIAGGNLIFTGEWRWHKKSVVVMPKPEMTTAPSATPAPTAVEPLSTSTLPTPSPDQQPPVQVLQQTQGNPPTPVEDNAADQAAKIAITGALTALVATQAFAVASDLKVLKWYNAKKAAEMRRAKT